MNTVSKLSAFLVFLMGLSVYADISVTLAWDRNPEPDIDHYTLYWGHFSGSYQWCTNAGNNTNVTVTGLMEGTNYCFVVTASNVAGLESDPSNEVCYQSPTQEPILPRSLFILASSESNQTEKLTLQLSESQGTLTNWHLLGSFVVTNFVPTNQSFYRALINIRK